VTFVALSLKEIGDLVRERRLLYFLFALSLIFSIVFSILIGFEDTAGPRTYMDVLFFAGPLFVAILAVVVAGDAVARERQDRTIHLLFTAPATKNGYLGALAMAHLVAFLAFSGMALLYAILAGVMAGWVAVPITLSYLALGLLPLFTTLSLVLVAMGARMASGRAALVLSTFLVMALWASNQNGPFGWLFAFLDWWPYVSSIHPFDINVSLLNDLRDAGVVDTPALVKLWSWVGVAAIGAWVSLRSLEVGR